MLGRRILRIKAFKVLYAYSRNREMTLKEAQSALDQSCEAVRDLYLFLLDAVVAVTDEAARLAEAARGKFNPTEEELNPNLKFVQNALAPLLREDLDFQKLLAQKKLSWEQYDVLVHHLFETLRSAPWFASYMGSPQRSLSQDTALFKRFYEEAFEDNQELAQILEDLSIHWGDDLPYALGCVIRSLDQIRRDGRWSFPPLYQSDQLLQQGKKADSDRAFVGDLLRFSYAHYDAFLQEIAANVTQWDADRLYTTDLILIAMGLAEAEFLPGIPLKVTLNEYVEIAKYYSTPRSRSFVNGLLDKLIREHIASGRITKSY